MFHIYLIGFFRKFHRKLVLKTFNTSLPTFLIAMCLRSVVDIFIYVDTGHPLRRVVDIFIYVDTGHPLRSVVDIFIYVDTGHPLRSVVDIFIYADN